jgi:glutamate-ammonia-ligase adenylyltransferase
MSDIASLMRDLPDRESVQRFIERLEREDPREFGKLSKNEGLLSDVLTLSAYSPLLTGTLLQNPHYISWLSRKRSESKVRDKEELLEALARFTLTNSGLETHVLLSRFQRRELLRIYLRDIRGLETISEITEELSNLADAILEHALRLARQELDNRYGAPQAKDDRARDTPVKFCVVSLGKLGSKELNYASDIDLFFLYSEDGTTSGTGNRGAVSNKEYFIKLSELITKIVGRQAGEGAAYRVDLRLRPHGRIGALAISLKEALEYYRRSARNWERQVLLRARSSAGNVDLFKDFYLQLEDVIYQKNITLEDALENVRLSKLKIDQEHKQEKGFNIKLGRGGIREIEFIAQAPQLALGNSDAWLRAPHTLISLTRLVDRGLLSKSELTELSDAYAFLRTLEHRVQMENGLQTHAIPEDENKRELLARRMSFETEKRFGEVLQTHTENVSRIYQHIFVGIKEKRPASENSENASADKAQENKGKLERSGELERSERNFARIADSLEKYSGGDENPAARSQMLLKVCQLSDHFSEMLAANPALIDSLPSEIEDGSMIDAGSFLSILNDAVSAQSSFRDEMAALRIEWSKLYLRIGILDLLEKIPMAESNALQTTLAEASIETALYITQRELLRKYNNFNPGFDCEFSMAVLALGRLGGRGLDHGSDLDLVLAYDDSRPSPVDSLIPQQFYAAAVEIFTTVISSFTRQGHLYRVDLRLRPDGKNGALCSAAGFFLEYLENRAAVWEWLAYVKIRSVGNRSEFAVELERKAKKILHKKAREVDAEELKNEILRVRLRLEEEKTRKLRSNEVHIKYSAGGLLDIYFLIRYLQLKNDVPDEDPNRSTLPMLKLLREREILNGENFTTLSEGYSFLRALDHALRLTAGRTTRLPGAGHPSLELIAQRLKLSSPDELLQKLTVHRVEIRQCFKDMLG